MCSSNTLPADGRVENLTSGSSGEKTLPSSSGPSLMSAWLRRRHFALLRGAVESKAAGK